MTLPGRLLRRLAPTLVARPRRHLPQPRLVRRLPARGARGAGAAPRTGSSASRCGSSCRELRAAARRARAAPSRAFVGADPDDLAFVPNATAGRQHRAALARASRRATSSSRPTTSTTPAATRSMPWRPRVGRAVVVAARAVPRSPRRSGSSRRSSPRVTPADAARAHRPRHEPDRARPPGRAARRASSRRAGSTRSSTARTRPGWSRSTSERSAPPTTPATATSGSARRRAPAFLHVRRDRQQRRSARSSISHGANSPRTDRSRFRLEFDWTGTADPTAYLCVPEAIRFLGSLLPGGWPALMAHNRGTALAARDAPVRRRWTSPPPAPDSMIGSLAALPVPPGFGPAPGGRRARPAPDRALRPPRDRAPISPGRRSRAGSSASRPSSTTSPADYEHLAGRLARSDRLDDRPGRSVSRPPAAGPSVTR